MNNRHPQAQGNLRDSQGRQHWQIAHDSVEVRKSADNWCCRKKLQERPAVAVPAAVTAEPAPVNALPPNRRLIGRSVAAPTAPPRLLSSHKTRHTDASPAATPAIEAKEIEIPNPEAELLSRSQLSCPPNSPAQKPAGRGRSLMTAVVTIASNRGRDRDPSRPRNSAANPAPVAGPLLLPPR